MMSGGLQFWRRVFSAGCVVSLVGVGALAVGGCHDARLAPPQGPVPKTEGEVQTLADFKSRVDAYADLHKRLEATLPGVPTSATPQQIDTNQRDLGKLLSGARASAKQGELLTPAMQTLVRKHLANIFRSRNGDDLKGSVMDENPLTSHIGINQRYPDEVPLSTMPPEVLQLLPKMPEELEYRFVGRSLVIMDVHAHMVVDYVTNAIPE